MMNLTPSNLSKIIRALEYYANENNYDDNCAPLREAFSEGIGHEEFDLGKTAREALKELV